MPNQFTPPPLAWWRHAGRRWAHTTGAAQLLPFLLLTSGILNGESLKAPGGRLSIDAVRHGTAWSETIRVRDGARWVTAFEAAPSVTRIAVGSRTQECPIVGVTARSNELVTRARCEAGVAERRIRVTAESDALEVETRFTPNPGVALLSVEDRYAYAPERRRSDTPDAGPLDFVWSQNIKAASTDLVAWHQFKSPVVMFQQGSIFAALMARPGSRRDTSLAFDLDVTSGAKPWMSYGLAVATPYGHSYFSRAQTGVLDLDHGAVTYRYSILASSQPPRLGYRSAVRRLWNETGRPALLESIDLQRNVRKPELELFDDWSTEAWQRYAGSVYREFDCGGRTCGSLTSSRNPWGKWDEAAPDAWFNSWFQTLRTAYGWYRYGQRSGDPEVLRKAESILTLALTSPRNQGAFATIFLEKDRRWINEDGWAGFPEDYHAFCMSWTAYWMLAWARDLTPQRKPEILAFVTPYADFLLKQQLASGAIPSWYDSNLKPRAEFGTINAETAGSAVLLLELAEQTGERRYRDAAARAMEFVTREVLPRQRWFDFETYLSCARKPFGFYDRWTAQYPQNNLSTIQAAIAYLKLYRATNDRRQLELGSQVLDYLLLTQQVWNPPALSPKLIGGFTTQNTDTEWSDARQCYAAALLWDYYQATGELEYLERAVAAARSTFAVAPWENWSHNWEDGDQPGAMTGLHWGTGSAMTSVEIMRPTLGDAYIDLVKKHGVGFNACSLTGLKIAGNSIEFDLRTTARLKQVTVRFAGVDTSRKYLIRSNGRPAEEVSGSVLARQGYRIQQY
jgi:hypothetical protein